MAKLTYSQIFWQLWRLGSKTRFISYWWLTSIYPWDRSVISRSFFFFFFFALQHWTFCFAISNWQWRQNWLNDKSRVIFKIDVILHHWLYRIGLQIDETSCVMLVIPDKNVWKNPKTISAASLELRTKEKSFTEFMWRGLVIHVTRTLQSIHH